jgi:hypothetical protein
MWNPLSSSLSHMAQQSHTPCNMGNIACKCDMKSPSPTDKQTTQFRGASRRDPNKQTHKAITNDQAACFMCDLYA